jgi:hypothetical protein
MTLKDLLIAGRQLEMSSFQAADIEQKQSEQEEVQYVPTQKHASTAV